MARIGGTTGNDVLVGEAGNDALNGGADADIILGGAGDDIVRGDFKTSNVQNNWPIQRSISTDANGVKLYTTTYNGVEFRAPTAGGDDTIYVGAINDWVFGECRLCQALHPRKAEHHDSRRIAA